MDIGIIMGPRNHPDHPYPLAEVYQDYIEDVVRAERLGFDNAWVGEHRMTDCQWTPSPMTVLAAMATRTSEIRLGTSVLCLPFHHPLRAAEDVVALDILSNGRFNFGFGAGSQFEEFRTFQIDSKDRMSRTYESAAFIRKALSTDEEFDWEGKYYTIPKVRFTTRPVQEEIPFYAGAIGPTSVRKAGEYGYHLIANSNPGWTEGVAAGGHDQSKLKAQGLIAVVVAETEEKAWEASEEAVLYFSNFYILRRQLDGSQPDPSRALTKEDLINRKFSPASSVAVGTPEQVLEQLSAVYKAQPAGQTGFAIQMRSPGMKTADVEKSMNLFAEHVMPELRKL